MSILTHLNLFKGFTQSWIEFSLVAQLPKHLKGAWRTHKEYLKELRAYKHQDLILSKMRELQLTSKARLNAKRLINYPARLQPETVDSMLLTQISETFQTAN